MKTGRNEPCPCGSGKKFKKCCLNTAKPGVRRAPMRERDPAFLAHAQAMLRQHQAAENVRQQQQGHGNPIVSWVDEANGFRFVAVKLTSLGEELDHLPQLPRLLHEEDARP